MTAELQALAVREEFALPAQARADAQLAEIEVFQKLVKNRLIEGHDYGVIPGTGTRATMLLPGAQKITKLAKCRPHYIVLREVEDWDREPQPLFAYTIQCQLIYLPTGEIVDEGVGECNSMESKYRWRQRERECPQCGEAAIIKGREQYGGGWLCFRKKGGCGAKFGDSDPAIVDQPTGRVLNPDIADQNNTILKMAKKRALVDAALSLGSLADLFTQDLDDISDPEPPTDVRSSPAEPPSEAESTVDEQIEIDKHRREMQASSDRSESDGGPAMFPPEQAATSGGLTKAPRFYSLDALIKYCEEKYGINEAGMVEIIGKPLSEGGKFSDIHAKIAAAVAEQGGSGA